MDGRHRSRYLRRGRDRTRRTGRLVRRPLLAVLTMALTWAFVGRRWSVVVDIGGRLTAHRRPRRPTDGPAEITLSSSTVDGYSPNGPCVAISSRWCFPSRRLVPARVLPPAQGVALATRALCPLRRGQVPGCPRGAWRALPVRCLPERRCRPVRGAARGEWPPLHRVVRAVVGVVLPAGGGSPPDRRRIFTPGPQTLPPEAPGSCPAERAVAVWARPP